MTHRRLLLLVALLVAGLSATLPAKAVDVTVESGACDSALSRLQVANAGVTRIRDIQGTNMLRRYVGRMQWQGERMLVGAEVHMFTCKLTNLVAPVTGTTPIFGRYARSGGHGGY
ncbi:MAG TPA: hypothetical protein VGV07_03355 [Devosia sp.]|jgi:hypothetical protein|uniref:hypothetical protein n=1 Tax=Devosia sp. TaxID=1871048 RepID=UPI002DDD86C6|nr:hypothetical protein [Devosia sp.]HEV2514259.1 hypothetical protein [Devosia sp.]